MAEQRGARLRSLVVASTLAVAISGCAVGPDYQRPDTPEPEVFARAEPDRTTVSPVESEFWRRFGDPELSQLVDDTLLANHDLRIGLARLDQSRALLRQTKLDRFPTVTAGADAAKVRASADQLPGVARGERAHESYDAGIAAFWELDFFGRVRRGVEAQHAESEAAAADLAALQVLVVADMVQTYVQLRGLQAQLGVAHANAEAQRESLVLVDARLDAGRGTEFDSARARALLESTLARIPALESQIAVAAHRIAVLSGRTPESLVQQLDRAEGTPLLESPDLDAPIATGTPGELLRRRPDIAAAERRLAAASARIGVATADLFPRLTLGGLLGSQAIHGSDLFESDSETYNLGLGIDWSFLDVGRVRARIAAADADAAANLARYQLAVLRALEESENALVRAERSRDERSHLRESAKASARAEELARIRFEGGVSDFLQVLDAERSRLEAEDELAQGQTRAALALVSVYRALAGGWPERVPAASAQSAQRE